MASIAFYDLKEIRRLFTVNALISSIDTVRPRDFYFGGEMHDFWEVVYTVSGSVSATAEDRVYTLSAGQVLFHKPLEFHRIWSANDTSPHVVIFSFDASGEGMRRFEDKLFDVPAQTGERIIKTAALIKDALKKAEAGRGTEEYALASHRASAAAEGLLLELCGMIPSAEGRQSGEDGGDYKRIVRVLHENAGENLSVPDIAALCNMSVSSLKKKFAAYSDKGVGKYFTYVKIRRAITMLCEGKSASFISDALGFSSVSYFYSVFKRETGLTPKEYLSQANPAPAKQSRD